jgi:hypothetical protein
VHVGVPHEPRAPAVHEDQVGVGAHGEPALARETPDARGALAEPAHNLRQRAVAEVRRVQHHQNFTWDARILCEYEDSGAIVRCTPFLTQTGFATEGAAWTRISSVVANDGSLRLLVNPANPLHAEVLDRRTY